jgi:pimeloyl-ACP methyl ester carboxylesterase
MSGRTHRSILALLALVFEPFAAGAQPVLERGRLTVHPGSVSCATDPGDPPAPFGTLFCRSFEITDCLDAPPITGVFALAQLGAKPRGTVILHSGGGGTSYHNDFRLADELVRANFRVIALKWDWPWFAYDSDPQASHPDQNIRHAACRPATLFHGLATVHLSTGPVCLEGHSGGSSAIGYSLAHYGLEQSVEAVLLSHGPPHVRIDAACDRDDDPLSGVAFCDGTEVEFFEPISHYDSVTGTDSCGAPSAEDLAVWSEQSVLSPAADRAWGDVKVGIQVCADPDPAKQNITLGATEVLRAALESAGTDVELMCYTPVRHQCSGPEKVYRSPAAVADSVLFMTSHCVSP